MGGVADGCQLFRDGQAIRADLRTVVRQHLLFKPREANHEELIEVASDDT